MAYTTIKKPSDYFNTKLYTGNGSTQSITGVNFQPDLVWNKQRNGTNSHYLFNAITGTGKFLKSNSTDAEGTNTDTVTSFDSDGFSLGSAAGNNGSGNTMVSWNWLASNTTASNTDGSITSTVSANTTSGFSIVKYTGNGTSPSTVGHGLGTTPSMIIVKNLTSSSNWSVYSSIIGNGNKLLLNDNSAPITSGNWSNTSPTSLVFTVNGASNEVGASGNNYIAYCFADVKGFSKFGSYVGNGSADGTFVYTGFKPAFVIVKKYSSTSGWYINDTARDFNGTYGNDASLFANTNGAEFTSSSLNVDMLSNGFKLRSNNSEVNGNTYTFIYMAFAEEPLVGDNPATAR